MNTCHRFIHSRYNNYPTHIESFANVVNDRTMATSPPIFKHYTAHIQHTRYIVNSLLEISVHSPFLSETCQNIDYERRISMAFSNQEVKNLPSKLPILQDTSSASREEQSHSQTKNVSSSTEISCMRFGLHVDFGHGSAGKAMGPKVLKLFPTSLICSAGVLIRVLSGGPGEKAS